jgi:hypothetical protein
MPKSVTHLRQRNAPSLLSAKLAPPILLQPRGLAEFSNVTGETVLVTMNGTYCAAMSPFSSWNMLTRRAYKLVNSLTSQWPSYAQKRDKLCP